MNEEIERQHIWISNWQPIETALAEQVEIELRRIAEYQRDEEQTRIEMLAVRKPRSKVKRPVRKVRKPKRAKGVKPRPARKYKMPAIPSE